MRHALDRLEHPLGHADRVLHRFSNALNMRIPLSLPTVDDRDVNLPWPIHKHVRVPREKYVNTYMSPHQMLSQMDRFGGMRKNIGKKMNCQPFLF